jgi:hypothetical protein
MSERTYTGQAMVEADRRERESEDAAFRYSVEAAGWYFCTPAGVPFPTMELPGTARPI